METGHEVRRVSNIMSKGKRDANEKPRKLSLFYVDLEPSEENKKIYTVKALSNGARISFEPPNKPHNELVQCHRCQLFGHTKTYCKRTPACVKCGMAHKTTDCPKAPSTPAKCIHCGQDHPASCRGCSVYQQLLRRRYGQQTNVTRNTRNIVNVPEFNVNNFPTLKGRATNPTPINNNVQAQPNVSYSKSARNTINPGPSFSPYPVNDPVLSAINELKNLISELSITMKSLVSVFVPAPCP